MTAAISKQNLIRITSRYKVILVDNYGVLRRITDRLPHAYQALSRLQSEGKEVFLFSNTGDNSEANLQQELSQQGVEIDQQHIITPGTALSLALQQLGLSGKKLLCLGNKDAEEYITRAGGVIEQSTDAEAAVIGSSFQNCLAANPHNYDLFVQTCVLQKKPTLILNLDELVPLDSRKSLAGPAYNWNDIARKTNVNLIGVGKPEAYMYRFALEQTGAAPAQVLAVGDTLQTDILGARTAGIDSLLVLTGLVKPHNYQGAISSTGLRPTFIRERFEF